MQSKLNRLVNSVDCLDVIFGFLFSFILLLGLNVYYKVVFNLFHSCVRLIIFSVLFVRLGVIFSVLFCVCNKLLLWLKKILLSHELSDKFLKNIFSAVALMLLFGIYFVCYISYYPGIFAYDVYNSLYQISENFFWNQQPILYTFFLKLILNVAGGNYTKMLVFYSVIQMTVVLCTCIGCLVYLQHKKVNNWLVVFGYLYFLLVPTLHIFSLVTTKDIFFSCAFMVFSISYVELKEKFSWNWFLTFVSTGLLSCMLRNNMIYAFLLFFLFLMFFDHSKRIVFSLIVVYVLFSIFHCICFLCGVAESPIHETLCVPINQLSCVYVKDNAYLTEEDKQQILKYIPEAIYYNPRFVDPVKTTFRDELYLEAPSKFWKLYLSMLRRYPFDFVKSFLNINIPYWFVCADPIDGYAQREYIESRGYRIYSFPIENRKNFLPSVNSFYESFARFENGIMRLFPFNLFFSLSFPFLNFIFCLYFGFKQRRRKSVIAVYSLHLLLLFTYLLGPVSNFRYIYTFYLCVPFYIGILFLNGEDVAGS